MLKKLPVRSWLALIVLFVAAWSFQSAFAGGGGHGGGGDASVEFPPTLDSYGDADMTELGAILKHRIQVQPFNLLATILFVCAIVHTFMVHKFIHLAHVAEERHRARVKGTSDADTICIPARIFHFLGEVEVVFGLWVLPLILALKFQVGDAESVHYVAERVNFTEPVFVVVIMAIASTRPLLNLAEDIMKLIVKFGGEKPSAWWFVLLSVGPLLGSFITEPGAMTICASLLAAKFYRFSPSAKFAYGTLGLLFVNISCGGVLTNFAAPPVIMVADAWDWSMGYMFTHFGWKAAIGIGVATILYRFVFWKELKEIDARAGAGFKNDDVAEGRKIPAWVTIGHVFFLFLTVVYSHEMNYLILIMLFFLAFVSITEDFQKNFNLRPPVMVGFFLAGLVIHGGLQQWWLQPILSRLGEWPLFIGATILTSFNDNAAITYLCSLVPGFTDSLKYAAMAGAVTGGGLTVIANAPNPAGQAILGRFFKDGVSALGLALGALIPTIILGAAFMIIHSH